MKPFQHTNPGRSAQAGMSRRRFFRQTGAAALSTIFLTSCDNLLDKIVPSKKDDRDKTLAFFGDSLTIGTGGTRSLGDWVGDAFSGRPTFTDGINGQIALSIAIRQGGVPLTLSVAGGKFDGTNPVAVTKLNNEFLSTPLNSNVYSKTGTLAGVKCTITRKALPDVGERYTVQPVTKAAETDTANKPLSETQPDIPVPDDSVFELEDAVRLRTATQILWYGRNDMTWGQPTDNILSAIKSSVAYIAEPRRYLVLGILPASTENKGTERYAKVTAFNDDLAMLYRDSYVPMTPPTDSEMNAIGFTPSTEDLEDIEKGNFPRRMRAANNTDEIHLNNFGYQIVANRVVRKIKDLKY
ncbi:SGNH/GDSL hydrolase family protein [Dyadobacter sp. 50-39]|uniref:SGNH/GDSL hydrolase family protein n=1 Tax=Dyadobacter sp. 50-39 TaxID=1895756 RepID=UPI0025C01BA8|nr:SGNH/GDSL hydrolase family protein [Dyadobacter sp. 50-39]